MGRLSPSDRALLELSLRSEVSDADIAQVLHVAPSEVRRKRRDALTSLARHMGGTSGNNLLAILEPKPANGQPGANRTRSHAIAAKNGARSANGDGGRGMPLDLEAARAGAASIEVRPSSRFELPHVSAAETELLSTPKLIGSAAAALACLVLVVVLLAGGGDERKPPDAKSGRPATPAAGLKAAMLPVGGETRATGSVQLRGSTLSVRAEDLPRASDPYTVWVYDSVAKAVPVGSLRGPNDSLEARLPKGFERYHFIDVSREPADGNPNHSGASVVRAPLKPLLAGR